MAKARPIPIKKRNAPVLNAKCLPAVRKFDDSVSQIDTFGRLTLKHSKGARCYARDHRGFRGTYRLPMLSAFFIQNGSELDKPDFFPIPSGANCRSIDYRYWISRDEWYKFLLMDLQTDPVGVPHNATEKASILIIDDSEDVLNLNGTLLEMDGYQVHKARSGSEGLELLSKMTPPDLILLDMMMDDMSGLEFLEFFKDSAPDIFARVPVVFLTGLDEVPPSDAVGIIQKPIDIDSFSRAVRGFIDASAVQQRSVKRESIQ